ncbi:MAG: hypothetical protein MJZ60_04900 [Bacteroidaceae bacterium]|nr:hypothetical protein [Bacteroidaceae bacterium]
MLDELVGIRILPRYSDGADLYRIKSIDSEGFYHSEVVEFSSNSIDFVEDETTFDDLMCQDALLISDEVFEKIVTLLEHKKNIVLEGAPGVGKTFLARKVAYQLIGEVPN